MSLYRVYVERKKKLKDWTRIAIISRMDIRPATGKNPASNRGKSSGPNPSASSIHLLPALPLPLFVGSRSAGRVRHAPRVSHRHNSVF